MNLARVLPRTAHCALAGAVAAAAMGAGGPVQASAAAPAVHASSSEHSGTALVRLGSRGLAVREWPDLMNRAFTGSIATVDHPVLVVDGGYWPETAAATRAVHAAAAIAQDGIVGPATAQP